MTSTLNASLTSVIDATAQAVNDDADNAHARFTATGAGTDGVRTKIRIGRHTVSVDEPPALGGEDSDPNPVETALAGLLSCQVVTYRFWAAKLDIPLDGVSVEVDGDLDIRGFLGFDDGVRPGFGEVRVVVTLDGPATEQRYRELHEAVDAHCPVLDLFRNTTPVSTELAVGASR